MHLVAHEGSQVARVRVSAVIFGCFSQIHLKKHGQVSPYLFIKVSVLALPFARDLHQIGVKDPQRGQA